MHRRMQRRSGRHAAPSLIDREIEGKDEPASNAGLIDGERKRANGGSNQSLHPHGTVIIYGQAKLKVRRI